MACGILTVGGTPQIYCVGGSAAGATASTTRVFSYNPVTDTVTALTAADNWPVTPAATTLPGGFAVVANKLYIIGGYDIGNASTNQTWQFDPTSQWVALTPKVNYPGDEVLYSHGRHRRVIYTAGGSTSSSAGTVIADSAISYKYDPVANAYTLIASIPRVTGETRGVVVNNQMWVLGGGRTAPNPSNEVDIYNPGTNTWSLGLPFVTARRNFPADSDGTSRVFWPEATILRHHAAEHDGAF